jgi:hypothetical protein
MTKTEQRAIAKQLKEKVKQSQEMFDAHFANPTDAKSLSFIIGFLQGAIESATFELEHF